MGAVKRALIVGGGIAGVTLALGFKKQGIEAEIVELSSQLMVAWSRRASCPSASALQCAQFYCHSQ